MSKKLIPGLLAVFLAAAPGFGQNFVQGKTHSQLRDVGFSDSFISRLQTTHAPVSGKPVVSLTPQPSRENVSFDPESFETEPPTTGRTPDMVPSSSRAGVEIPMIQSLPPLPAGYTTSPDPSAPIFSMETNAAPKPAAASSRRKKNRKKQPMAQESVSASVAPIVQSIPNPPILSSKGSLPPPQNYMPTPPAGNGQEIYSQEPLSLPPISQLGNQSRTTLPPVSQQAVMDMSLREVVSRVLACNYTGLTGLHQTTSADVSQEGSFKMGFHTNWFTLERVYDRVLASGESGRFFESPIFFNYAATSDLEFAFFLPIVDYTIKSRILWPADFRESGLGDSKLSFKYRIFDNPQYQMRGAFGLGFKFPTGSSDKGLGTGKTDFEVYTSFSKNFERIIAHLNLGYVMTGDPNTQFYPDGLADIFYYNIGLEYPHANNVTVMAEVNGQDWGSEGLKVDVVPGLRYTPTENFALDIGVPISVTNDQRYGYNYRVTFGITSFFR